MLYNLSFLLRCTELRWGTSLLENTSDAHELHRCLRERESVLTKAWVRVVHPATVAVEQQAVLFSAVDFLDVDDVVTLVSDSR